MQLIGNIINELIDVNLPLTGPLLKTKFLASKLKNDDLMEWVNHELNGYVGKNPPDYRVSRCKALFSYTDGYRMYSRHNIPYLGDDTWNDILYKITLRQGIAALESLDRENSKNIQEAFYPQQIAAIQSVIIDLGNDGISITSAWKEIPINVVISILTQIRTKLLDFMLKIDEEFCNITQIEDLKSKNKQITQYMNQTIINNNGDGNVVNTGNSSTINATVNIHKGNKDALMNTLRKHKVDEMDIQELVEVIDNESPNAENKTFGHKVSEWFKKMTDKSLDGSWTIGISAAGKVLADAISSYYGIK